ncbi:MAG: Hsp70 family protein, partial [Polyangiaceae bacterium]|nr:Hsp70 family protein [Polyangiaceae bacterium]
MHLGIDFGTTRTVVAACDRGNYPIVSFQSEDGDHVDWYPSLIAEKDGELRCGWDAHACVGDPSWFVIRSFKRFLSDPAMRSDLKIRVGSTSMPLFELLTTFISSLANDLRKRSNIIESLQDVERIPTVIATPANAHGTQRFFTIEAFRRAGFDVLALLNEPSAAGFEYAHRYRSSITSKREHVVVYDLGGGTFDASLVHMKGQHHDVASTSGVARLGGDDFDDVLADLVASEMGISEGLDPSLRTRLVDACREAKEKLGQASRRVLVDVESALGADAPVPEVALPVSRYYEACSGLIERTI